MNGVIGGNALIDANLILNKVRLSDRMKIADLGCGASGHFVFPAAKIVGKRGIVYAVDILKTALETVNKRAKLENYENIKTVWSNLEIFGATKIESASIDIAMLINTLYQSHKRLEIIREANRMVKKGGRLIIVEWKNIASPFGPPAEERVDKSWLENIAIKFGLQVEDDFEAGQYHYGLLYFKI